MTTVAQRLRFVRRRDGYLRLSMGADPHRSDRVGQRVGSRVAIGLMLGPIVGGILGFLVGLIFYGAGSRGMWVSLIVGVIFGALLGGFWGGLGGLGPPAQEDEPLDRELDDGNLVEGEPPT